MTDITASIPVTQTGFRVIAHGIYNYVSIKLVRDAFSGKVVSSTTQELLVRYGPQSFCFLFRFGSIVFFNVPEETMERDMGELRKLLPDLLEEAVSDSIDVHVGAPANAVEFEHVALKKVTIQHLRLVARSIGQSVALETFESRAERILSDTFSLLENMAKKGKLPIYSRKLLQTIGSVATTRQQILTNLAVLDAPDEVWDSKELDRLYEQLHQNFDIAIRFRSLDRKLQLLQDNIEIILDLNNSRKTNFLEAVIVVLIVLEILLALV